MHGKQVEIWFRGFFPRNLNLKVTRHVKKKKKKRKNKEGKKREREKEKERKEIKGNKKKRYGPGDLSDSRGNWPRRGEVVVDGNMAAMWPSSVRHRRDVTRVLSCFRGAR